MSITDERHIVRTAGIVSKVKKIFTKCGQPMLFATIEDDAPAIDRDRCVQQYPRKNRSAFGWKTPAHR